MDLLNRIKNQLYKPVDIDTEPELAYDLWSSFYDDQPDNLMLHLDEKVFSLLLENIDLQNKIIIDFGCGTGRHWNKILEKEPAKLIGYDISQKMLEKLKIKYPNAETKKINDNLLSSVKDNSIDAIISTLTIAHISDISELFCTWNRILKNKADMLITDFHPAVLAVGGKRVFRISGKQIKIKNFAHPLIEIESLAASYGFSLLLKKEIHIDEHVRDFYEKQNAMHIYNKYKGQPIIYGMHFKKQ